MPKFGPISRRNLIRYLKQLGFKGPYPGDKHHYTAIKFSIKNKF